MILAIDMGNTNIVIGCVDEKKTYFFERISTVKTKTELEYAIDINMVLKLNDISPEEIEGGIVCSVVPQLTNIIRIAAEKVLKKKVLVVGPGIRTGLNISLDNPTQLGADLVAGAVAGINEYPLPLIIIDMGTATTICVIDSNKTYIGGMIFPGVIVSLNSLTSNTSQLQGISLDAPKALIGKNTIDCMKSGIIYGNASMLDGMITRIQTDLGQKCTVVATGGLSKAIVPFCKEEIVYDDDLLMKGLLVIYNKNK